MPQGLVFFPEDLSDYFQMTASLHPEKEGSSLPVSISPSLFCRGDTGGDLGRDLTSLFYLHDWKRQLLASFYFWKEPQKIQDFLEEHPFLVDILMGLLSYEVLFFGEGSERVLDLTVVDDEEVLVLEIYTHLPVEEAGASLECLFYSFAQRTLGEQNLLLLDIKLLG